MDLVAYNKSYAINPSGFPNFGNSCFFNSLLQCLLSCTSIFEVLERNKDVDHIKDNPLAQQLLSLHAANLAKEDLSGKCKDFWVTVMAMAQRRTDKVRFTPGAQHDAHEGLMLFLDMLDDIPEVKHLFEHRHRIQVLCDECKKFILDHKETNLDFKIQADLKNNQHIKFANIDEYYNTSMPLNDFLRKQNDFVEGYTCPECKSTAPKFQTTTLTMIPEILPVILKKYYQKINTPFPAKLIFNAKGRGKRLIYNLIAQSEHSGSMTGGHYWAIGLRRSPHDTDKLVWAELNDSHVSNGVPGPTENTYMLFYHYVGCEDIVEPDINQIADQIHATQ